MYVCNIDIVCWPEHADGRESFFFFNCGFMQGLSSHSLSHLKMSLCAGMVLTVCHPSICPQLQKMLLLLQFFIDCDANFSLDTSV